MTPTTLPLEGDSHVVYSNSQIGDDVAAIIKNFTPMMPKRLWNDAVAEFTRSAVTDFAPNSSAEASIYMSVVSRLASWTVEVACNPLERRVVFDGRQIEAYVSRGLTGRSPSKTRAVRLQLLRIAAELQTFDPDRRDAGKQPRIDPFAPYTSAEIVRLRSQGNTRSTPLRRHNWMTLLALGAGCALNTTEIVGLLVEDIELAAGAIRVHVRGKRARSVICLADWEAEIGNLLMSPLVSTHLFVKTERPQHPPMYVGRFINTVAKRGERFTVERLRSTWIAGHLQAGTDPVALMHAVGVKSFSTFERLVPYISMPSDDVLTTQFRREARS